MRHLDGPHEFTEDVNDASMCMCGIPALTHDLAMDARSSYIRDLGSRVERDADDFDPMTKDPDALRAASYWAKLVKARATHQRIAALIDTWHKSPDLRTRDYSDRLSEALDGRPRE